MLQLHMGQQVEARKGREMTSTPMRHRLMRIIDTMRDEHESGTIVDALLAELERPSEAMIDGAVRDGHGKTVGERAVNTFTAMVRAIRDGA
jgi:hypothetical protein